MPHHCHDALPVTLAVETINFPDIGLDPRMLQRTDGAQHQFGPGLAVVGVQVSAEGCQLLGRGRYQQLEHEPGWTTNEGFGQSPKARLATVHRRIAFGGEASPT